MTLRTRGVESPIESARIARGHVKPVTELSPDDYDALLIPLLVAAPAASGDAGNGHAISLQKKAGPPRLERLIFIKAPNTWRRFANPDAGASQLLLLTLGVRRALGPIWRHAFADAQERKLQWTPRRVPPS